MNAQSIYTTKHGDFLKGIISREYKTINQLEVNTIAEQIRKLNPRVNLGRHSLERLVGGLEIKLPQFNFACYARMTGFTQGAHCVAPIVGGTQAVISSYKPTAQMTNTEVFVVSAEAFLEFVTHPKYKSIFLNNIAVSTDIAVLARTCVTVGLFTRYKITERLGKQYITFTSQTKWSHVLKDIPRVVKNSSYRIDNPKVLGVVYATKHLKEAVVSGAKITIVAFVGFEILKYILSDEATLSHLIGTAGMDIAKVVVSSGITVGAGAVAGIYLAKAGITLVGLPFAVAIGVGVGASIVLDRLDERYDITNKVIGMLDEASSLPESVVSRASSYYELLEQYLATAAKNPYLR